MDFKLWSLALFLLASSKGCSGDITYFPQNAAVKVGGTAVFNCTSSSSVIAWYLSRNGTISGSSYEQITTGCDVQSGYSAHYKTEPSGGYHPICNLIVLDSTLQQAGVYVCSDGLSENQRAFVLMTVVDSPPNMTSNQSDVVVGETLRVSCRIGYNGSVYPAPLLPPSIYWTSSTGENISSALFPSPPPNSVESYILVSPDGSSNFIGPFNCHGYFEEPKNIVPGYATNAPTLSSSTTSQSFQVFQQTTILYLNGSDCTGNICYCNSDGSVTLSCNAKGYPMPGYGWSKANDSPCFLSTTNNKITVTSNGTYQCTAENEFHGTKYTDSTTITVMGCASPETWICGVPANVVVSVAGVPCPNDTCTCPCANCTSVILACIAEAAPPAEYKWSYSGHSLSGPTIVATENTEYQCTAYNWINSIQYTASRTITVNGLWVEGVVDENHSCDETVTIVLGVFMAISILANILLVTWIVFWLLPKVKSQTGSIPKSGQRYLDQTKTEIETTRTHSSGTSPTLGSSHEQQAAYEEPLQPYLTSNELMSPTSVFYQELKQSVPPTYEELRPRNK